jgi:hypothetical protein
MSPVDQEDDADDPQRDSFNDAEALRDIVIQHVAHAIHPLTEHLYQLDMSVNFAQQALRQLNGDVTEVKSGLGTTNRCLELLREGLGKQGEKAWLLERSMEQQADKNARTEARLDGTSDSVRGLQSRLREADARAMQLQANLEERNDAAVRLLRLSFEEVKDQMEGQCLQLKQYRCDLDSLQCQMERVSRQYSRELRAPEHGCDRSKGSGKQHLIDGSPAHDMTPGKWGMEMLIDNGQERCDSRMSQLPGNSSVDRTMPANMTVVTRRSGPKGDARPQMADGQLPPVSRAELPSLVKPPVAVRPPEAMIAPRLRFAQTLAAHDRGDPCDLH